MQETQTLIIGASFAGLASASTLIQKRIGYIIIEKEDQIAPSWRKHYERLHLHTNKRISSLPFKKFERSIPRYPSRIQVIQYLEDYKNHFGIQPQFHTEAKSIFKEGDSWITETNNGTFKSKFLILATGPFGKARNIYFEGMESFTGPIVHSTFYKSGKDYKGKKVLVVGFGNSACEIAIDLHEQGAFPSMAVRSAVNVIPRDIFGIPVVELAILNRSLPPKIADQINAPLINFLTGDITKLGLRKKEYGPAVQIEKDGQIPLLDIGTLRHIRKGNIKIFSGIDHIDGFCVHFTDGENDIFDAIIAAIGYDKNVPEYLEIDKSRLDDLKLSIDKQHYFGKDGLYFCGYWVSPTGQIREINLDAKKISTDISKKIRQS